MVGQILLNREEKSSTIMLSYVPSVMIISRKRLPGKNFGFELLCCRHQMHLGCLARHLGSDIRTHRQCPLCRTQFNENHLSHYRFLCTNDQVPLFIRTDASIETARQIRADYMPRTFSEYDNANPPPPPNHIQVLCCEKAYSSTYACDWNPIPIRGQNS